MPTTTKPKSKAKPKAKRGLSQEQWAEIRLEWDAGQIPIRLIAEQHGISHPSILKRARQHGWPLRPESVPVVTALATRLDDEGISVTNPHIALTAFHRVMLLLITHRKRYATLMELHDRLIGYIERHEAQWLEKSQLPRVDQLTNLFKCVASAAQAISKIHPHERRAFGLTDHDGPSEFDALTVEQQEAVVNVVGKILGVAP